MIIADIPVLACISNYYDVVYCETVRFVLSLLLVVS